MAGEADPPQTFVVSWTKAEWAEKWPHRLEAMMKDTTLKKSPYVVAFLKEAVAHYESTGEVLRPRKGVAAKK